MMRGVCVSTLPHQQPSFSSLITTACEVYSPASSASWCRRGSSRRRGLILCALPARDVVIDFGKFKGCKMGTLPSSYLRWLIRESKQSQLAVWGDYAKQVLDDPYYRDRIEWEGIERLAARGDMRKRGPPVGDLGVKGSMRALGWDLSDRTAWSKVNFSLLGTSLGGRIPRVKADAPHPNSTSKKLPSFSPAAKQEISSLGSPQSKSLSLKEELLRRRHLRKERSSSKSLNPSPSITIDVGSPFPGRDSFLKRAPKRGDT